MDLLSAARRHPRWVDAGSAVLLGLVTLPSSVDRSLPAAGWLALGVMLLALVARRRAPLLVFWLIYAVDRLAGAVGVDAPAAFLVVLFAVYTVARHRPRRHLLPVGVAIAAALLLAGIAVRDDWQGLAAVGALSVAAALLGTNLSTRRAYLDQLEERARRAEHDRDQQARLATAAERARMAREMHDVVAHNLAVIVALADAAALTATATPAPAGEKMRLVAGVGREALAEMRRLLAREDETGPLAPQPGLDDLDRLVDQVRAAGLPVAFTRSGSPAGAGPGAALAVYRIAQEALTNTLKHAGPAATAHLRLAYTDDGVELDVTDDGSGRPAASPEAGAGRGLAGMRERAAAHAGRVEAGPLPGAGWRVTARLRLA